MENRKPQEPSAEYWRERFKNDSAKISDNQRAKLAELMLIKACGLSGPESKAFLSDTPPHAGNIDHSLSYSSAEKKVADFYGGMPEPEVGTPEHFELARRAKDFRSGFEDLFRSFYNVQEMGEIFSFGYRDGSPVSSRLSDASFITVYLGGPSLLRKVRNAYLPTITDVLREDENEQLKDVSHEFFDGPEDAVSQVEKLTTDNPPEE